MPIDYRDPARGRRVILIAGVVAFALQVAIAPQVSLLGGRFNFMAAYACAVALQGEPGTAAVAGFASGLAYDLTASVPVGLMALILTVGSYVLAGINAGAGGALSGRTLQLLGICLGVECLLNGIILMVMGIEGSILTGLVGHGVTTAVLSTVAGSGFLLALGSTGGSSRGFTARGKGSRLKGIR